MTHLHEKKQPLDSGCFFFVCAEMLYIVPFVYGDSCAYWAARERASQGTIAEIEHQMREASARAKKVIAKKETKPRKFEVDFSVLDDLEEDE